MVDPLLRRETLRVEKLAGIVPVPVAAMIAGSACCSSHSIVSPSDLWPNSLVNWNTLAAQVAGIRMRRPRPSTLVWRSLVDLFGAAAADAVAIWLLLASDLVAIARDASICGCGGAVVDVEAVDDDAVEAAEPVIIPPPPPPLVVDRPAWIEIGDMNGPDRPSKASTR